MTVAIARGGLHELRMRNRILAGLISLPVACGGPKPAAQAPAPEPVAPSAAPAASASAPAPSPSETASAHPAEAPPATLAPTKPWAELSHDERIAHMKTVVVPHMKAIFQSGPVADHYKEFGCTVCHGPGAKQGKFTMPSGALPKLDARNGFRAHMEKTPEVTKWMMQTVLPEMAKTLGQEPFDPATKSGFACSRCHEIKH